MRNRLNIIVKVHREQNDFSLVCSVKRALRRAGVSEERIAKIRDKALAEGTTTKDVKRILGRWVKLRFVKTTVRVANVVCSKSGLHHWVARWRDPMTGKKRGQVFRMTAEEIQQGWPKGWKVVFVDPEEMK